MERPRTEPSRGPWYIEGFSQHVIDTGLITFLGKCRVNDPTLRFHTVCRSDPSRSPTRPLRSRPPSFGIARWILKPSSVAARRVRSRVISRISRQPLWCTASIPSSPLRILESARNHGVKRAWITSRLLVALANVANWNSNGWRVDAATSSDNYLSVVGVTIERNEVAKLWRVNREKRERFLFTGRLKIARSGSRWRRRYWGNFSWSNGREIDSQIVFFHFEENDIIAAEVASKLATLLVV